MPALAATLLLASAALSASDRSALDAATHAIFAPYRQTMDAPAPWERDIWTDEIQHLITHWQSVAPEGEIDALNDGDWLCQCQDWDNRKFRIQIASHKATGPGAAEVAVDIFPGFGDPRDAFLAFRREHGRWMLDDLYSEGHSDGIKDALRATILEDEQLQKGKP